MPRRRRRSGLRLVLILLVAALALPTLSWLGASLLVDADAWRPQIIAAVRRTTGRELRIGHLRMVPALMPTLSITEVSLANLPGGSSPEMLRVPRAQVKLSLLPLLAGRIEIARLVLERPEILLERDADGTPNWRLGEALTMAASPADPASAAAPARPGPVVRELVIESGEVRWRGGKGERRLALQRLTASAYGLESPVTVEGRATYAGLNLALEAECGPLSRLVDRKAIAPWPLKGTLETPGARLAFSGTLRRPLEGSGYIMALEAATVNLPVLDAFLGRSLPPLRQVAVAARLVDGEGSTPEISGIALRIGASDLDFIKPGLRLARGEFSAASLADKLRGEIDLSLGGTPVHLTVALGSLAGLLAEGGLSTTSADPTALSVELGAEVAGATLAVNGTVPVPLARSGIDLAVTGRIPDLSLLSPLAGVTLPALRPLMVDGRVVWREPSPALPAGGVAVRGLALATPEADLAGEIAVDISSHPSVQGNFVSRRIDLDAIRAAMAPPAGGASPEVPPPGARLFTSTPLPWSALMAADLDLRLSVGELRLGGAAWRDVAGHAVLQSGRLALDPVTASLSGGRASARLTLDATTSPPQAALALRAPGLSLRPLAVLLGLPGDAVGNGALDLDLHAAGRSSRSLAATLAGRMGLTVTDAELDNRLLSLALPALMPQALPQAAAEVQALARPGRARMRCLLLRAEVDAGTVALPLLALEAGRFTLQGSGAASLREETMQIHLRPVLRDSPVPVVPMRLAGALTTPRLGAEPRGAALPAWLPGSERGDVCAPAQAAMRAARAAARATGGTK